MKPAVWLGLGAVVLTVTTVAVARQNATPSKQSQSPPMTRYASESTKSARSSGSIASLRELDAAFTQIVDEASQAVVHIRSESRQGGSMMAMAGQGSGVIYKPDGWIITNDHVVNGFDKVTVILHDGREVSGKVTRANDPNVDIAVVKVDAGDLPVARWANSDDVRAGQFAIAIGSPFGFENSVTVGHISGLGRTSQIGDYQLGARAYTDLLQTDAPINPGNSGGPLFNIDGQVVGINTSIYSGTGGNVGIGFAIPCNQVRFLADLLIKDGKITRGYIGVLPENLKEFEKKEQGVASGAIIRQVPEGGPAAAAGVQAGDIVTRIGEYEIHTQVDLRNAMLRLKPGTTVNLELLRNKKPSSVKVKIAEPPKTVAQAPLRRPSNELLNPEDMLKQLPGLRDWQSPHDESDVPPVREGKAKFGITVAAVTEELRKQYSIPSGVEGAVVQSVSPGSVASRLGLKPGDVIKKIGDAKVTSPEDLVKAMSDVNWGDSRHVDYGRYGNGSQINMSVDVEFK